MRTFQNHHVDGLVGGAVGSLVGPAISVVGEQSRDDERAPAAAGATQALERVT